MACHTAGSLSACTACKSRCMYAFMQSFMLSRETSLVLQSGTYSPQQLPVSQQCSFCPSGISQHFASCGNTAFLQSSPDSAPNHKPGVMGVHESGKQLVMLLSYVCWCRCDVMDLPKHLFQLFSMLMTGGTINIVLLGCSATADIFIALQSYLSISYSTSGTVESLVEQQSLQKAQHMPQNVFSC